MFRQIERQQNNESHLWDIGQAFADQAVVNRANNF